MTQDDIAQMADLVAQAIYSSTDSEEQWADLTDEERGAFLKGAHAAMGAHDAFLTANRYAIVKLKRAARGKLIVPPKPTLIKPH